MTHRTDNTTLLTEEQTALALDCERWQESTCSGPVNQLSIFSLQLSRRRGGRIGGSYSEVDLDYSAASGLWVHRRVTGWVISYWTAMHHLLADVWPAGYFPETAIVDQVSMSFVLKQCLSLSEIFHMLTVLQSHVTKQTRKVFHLHDDCHLRNCPKKCIYKSILLRHPFKLWKYSKSLTEVMGSAGLKTVLFNF